MGTSDKLLYLQDTKVAIKNAIVAKGVSVPTGTAFRDYATKIGDITSGSATGSETADTWVRPAEWLALPDNIEGVQKVSILNAVFDTDSELVAFTCAGAYTVDWGDGVVENFANSVKAEHKYDYTNINLNSDTVATLGYKQCIITITPQSGQNLTLINLNTYHSVIGPSSSSDMTTGFLDLRINSLSCSNLTISSTSDYVKHLILQQCIIGEILITNTSNMFANCGSLQSVPLFDLSLCTNTTQMFNGCYSLRSVPLFNLIACKNTSSMFNSCYSLQSVPLFDLSLCTNTTQMFNGCYSLQSVPLFDLRACTNTTQMFANCGSLQSVPLFNLIACKNTSSMFNSCYSLQSVPLFDLSLCTNTTQMFNGCYSVKKMTAKIKVSFSLANAKMSADALNAMYTALPTVTGQTITVTGNYGTATDTPSIATAKGWTVTG